MFTTPEKYLVLGMPVHLLADYPSWVMQRQAQKQGTHIVTLNAEMAILGEKTPQLFDIIQQADLVIPDGAGVVIYLKIRGYQQKRVPGIELAEALIEQVAKLKGTIAFYGGKPEVVQAAAKNWQQKIPDISLLTSHGYLNPEEQEDWQNTLKQQQPQLVLVGLGVPRQEYWITEHRVLSPNSIWIGVGGSFDIWSGLKVRAPPTPTR